MSDDNPIEVSIKRSIGYHGQSNKNIIGKDYQLNQINNSKASCTAVWSSHQSFQCLCHYATMSIVLLVQATLAFGGFIGTPHQREVRSINERYTPHRRACCSLDTNDENLACQHAKQLTRIDSWYRKKLCHKKLPRKGCDCCHVLRADPFGKMQKEM